MTRWLLNVLIALDQLVNAVIFLGEPDETMSSAAWRMEQQGHFWGCLRPAIDLMFSPLEKDHCQKAYQSELKRTQYAKDFQQMP